MFKNSKIMVIAVALLLVVCLTGGTVAAYAASAANKGNGYIDEQEDAALAAQKQSKKNEIPLDANGNPAAPGGRGSQIQAKVNQNIAVQWDIDISGMTDEEIMLAVKNHALLDDAARHGVDITGMTDGQIKEVMEAYYFEEQSEYAAELGIDTTGMTTGDEIREAIRDFKINRRGQIK
ncbi:MAG: hypothetical protein LBH09_00150 [Peptococcaceae bacterium]|jgi:hypothetical protein|nr:hypothetical protein [Peptococcaceae bacterium]